VPWADLEPTTRQEYAETKTRGLAEPRRDHGPLDGRRRLRCTYQADPKAASHHRRERDIAVTRRLAQVKQQREVSTDKIET